MKRNNNMNRTARVIIKHILEDFPLENKQSENTWIANRRYIQLASFSCRGLAWCLWSHRITLYERCVISPINIFAYNSRRKESFISLTIQRFINARWMEYVENTLSIYICSIFFAYWAQVHFQSIGRSNITKRRKSSCKGACHFKLLCSQYFWERTDSSFSTVETIAQEIR